MKLMDEVAGIVASRHCNTNVVTASVDAINFHRKIKKGEDDTENLLCTFRYFYVNIFAGMKNTFLYKSSAAVLVM